MLLLLAALVAWVVKLAKTSVSKAEHMRVQVPLHAPEQRWSSMPTRRKEKFRASDTRMEGNPYSVTDLRRLPTHAAPNIFPSVKRRYGAASDNNIFTSRAGSQTEEATVLETGFCGFDSHSAHSSLDFLQDKINLESG